MFAAQLIIAAIFGLLFGNFATSYFHRIPSGKPIRGYNDTSGIPPHCSECNHRLKFYEYLPLLSWISCRFKCNYCGCKIDPFYPALESMGLICSLVLFLILGFCQSFIWTFLASISTSLYLALLIKHKKSFSLPLQTSLLFIFISFLSFQI